jgi:hypothetical protein
VFYMDVAKVDRDVTYAAVAIHVYCKSLFQMFHLFFQTYVVCLSGCCKCVYLSVTYVSHIYCKCFIWKLYMFFNGFPSVSIFLSV